MSGIGKALLGLGLLLGLAGLPSIGTPATQQEQAPNPQELVFLAWPDYLDPHLVATFEQSHGVKIRFVYFETDDDRDEIMAKADGRGFDLAVVNSPSISVYRRFGWLSRIGAAEVPNLRHIDPRWITAIPAAQGYGIPYFWGTTGIAYRRDLVPEPIHSWRQFFSPAEGLRGKIGLIRDSRDMIGMALKSLGFSANSAEPAQIRAAEQILLKQIPYLGEIGYWSLKEDSDLVSGKLWVAMMFSGDALMVKRYRPDIVYTVPDEGGEIWIDYLAVPESSRNKALAAELIDFVNEPQWAARNAQFVQYATPNTSAERFLPAEFLADPVIYPGKEVLSRSEYFVDLPAAAVKLRNDVCARVLGAGDATVPEVRDRGDEP